MKTASLRKTPSQVFRIDHSGEERAMKMVQHCVGSVEANMQSMASERAKRGEAWRIEDSDREAAKKTIEHRESDEGLREELGGEWQHISRLMKERPHQNLAPILHWFHASEPSLRGGDEHGFYVLDEAMREGVARRTLFMVMQFYPQGSLDSLLTARGMGKREAFLREPVPCGPGPRIGNRDRASRLLLICVWCACIHSHTQSLLSSGLRKRRIVPFRHTQ